MDGSIRKKLMAELKNIYDDKDFVCSTSSILGNERNRKKMLEFLQAAKERGEDVTSDDVLLMAMEMREEEDNRRGSRGKKRYVRAAML